MITQNVKRVIIGLATIIPIIVASFPIIEFIDNKYAHAEDVQRSDTQIMIELQEINISSQARFNDYQIRQYRHELSSGRELNEYDRLEYEMLREERTEIRAEQNKLKEIRRTFR